MTHISFRSFLFLASFSAGCGIDEAAISTSESFVTTAVDAGLAGSATTPTPTPTPTPSGSATTPEPTPIPVPPTPTPTPPPSTIPLDPYLHCMAQLYDARVAYNDQLTQILSAPAAELPGVGPATSGPVDLASLSDYVFDKSKLDTLTPEAGDAYLKLQDFETSFYQERVISNPALHQCTELLSTLERQPGYFDPSIPLSTGSGSYWYGEPVPTGTQHVGALNVVEPVAPRPNCMGLAKAISASYLAGIVDKDDTTTCDDYDRELGRSTGMASLATGGDRKETMRGKNGKNCEMAAPIANIDFGILFKPYALFVPAKIRIQRPDQNPEYVDNEKAKFAYDVPDDKGKVVKHGPVCPADAEITLRTTAEMGIVYHIHALVEGDPDGKGGGPDSFQAMVDIDQKCYGPGTQIANPNTFSIVESEADTQIRLRIMRQCEIKTGWEAGVNASASMSNKPNVGVGFQAGISETKGCAENMDQDNFATGGCTASQKFGNVSLTTKPQNGLIPIAAVYQMFNPNDPAQGGAPVGWLKMGMQMNSSQTRATSTVASTKPGLSGGAVATVLFDRKKIIDKAGDPKRKLEFGMTECALLAKGQPRPAKDCMVPVGSFPWIARGHFPTVPTGDQLKKAWEAMVKAFEEGGKK